MFSTHSATHLATCLATRLATKFANKVSIKPMTLLTNKVQLKVPVAATQVIAETAIVAFGFRG
jgi:hypothetical protein